MKRALRWLVRGVLVLLALAVLAIAIVIGAVHTDRGRSYVRTKIVEQLQSSFPGSRIDSLTGSPFGTLVLHGITLMARDGKPLATIDELRVRAALTPLMSHRVVVEDIALRGVHVSVRPQPPAPPSPRATEASEPSAWTIELPVIALADAAITLTTTTGLETIDQLDAQLAIMIPAGQPIAIDAYATARWRGTPVTVRALADVSTTVHVPLAVITVGDASTIVAGAELGNALTGAVRAFVPAALARELAGAELPGDGELLVDAGPAIHLRGTLAENRVDATVVAELATTSARGIIEAHAPQGDIVAAVSADPAQVRGILAGAGTDPAVSSSAAVVASTNGAELIAAVQAAGPVAAEGAVHARVVRTGENWTLAQATVRGHATNPGDMRGRVDATLALQGPITPEPVLAVRGTVDGRVLRQQELTIADVHATVAGDVRRATQTLAITVGASGVQSGTTRVPRATLALDVTRKADGTLSARLGPHEVVTADHATWSGHGGTVNITEDAIEIADVHTRSERGEVTASARIGRTSDALAARVKARGIALAIADPTLRGHVDADLDVARSGARWKGRATVHARGVATPAQPALDGDVTVTLAGSKVTVDGAVSNPELGRATLAATVAGPRDITNAQGWRALPRTAIEHATLTLEGIDARAVGRTGRLDSTLVLGARDASGEVHVRGVETKGGSVDVDAKLTGTSPDTLDVSVTARTTDLPPAVADASLALPAHPFDPQTWQRLGRRALRSAHVSLENLAVEPSLLARFGVLAPYRAAVDVRLDADAGASNVTLAADVRGLSGGRLTLPVDVHLEGATGAQGSRADLTAKAGKLAVTFRATSPLTVARALAGRASTEKVDATLTLPDTQARDLLGLFGETEVVSGTVGGTLTFAGTARAPTLHADLVAKRLAMAASSITNRRPPTLDSLELQAMWSPQHAEATLVGHEGKDRLLKVAARGDLHDWRSLVGSIEAANFDIAPLAVFAPGAARAARGTLNASLKIRGIDPQTGDVRGMLAIRDGRFPLSPTLGTMRRTSLDVQIVKKQITTTFDGHLGAGDGNVKGTLTAKLTGGLPTSASLDMKLSKVSPIGALQPVIDGDVAGNWATPDGIHWNGSMTIRNGKVYVPPESGYDLLEAAAPTDMIFVDKIPAVKKIRRSTTEPWLVTTIAIGNTNIDVEDNDVHVLISARGKLTATLGNGLDLRGMITTTHGVVDVLGRRYRVDNALLDFQGTTEPRLDIRMVHDFKDLTLTVDIRGTSLEPDLRLSGDPSSYTQGQLLSFLMGAEPNAEDSTAQTNQAVVSGGLTVLSSRIGRSLNKHLPIKFDAINYEAGTSSSSKAVRFGLRLSDRAYLLWRQRLAARPDENPGEAVLEYQLRQSLLFETTVGERAKGGDLLYRYRW